MMKRRFQFSALLATTCVAALPRPVLAQAADAPPAEAPPAADAAAPAAPDAPPASASEAEVALSEPKVEPIPEPVKVDAPVSVRTVPSFRPQMAPVTSKHGNGNGRELAAAVSPDFTRF